MEFRVFFGADRVCKAFKNIRIFKPTSETFAPLKVSLTGGS